MMLDRCCRFVGTALAFAAFGIGGLLIGLFAAPILFVCIRDTARRQRAARRLISFCFRALINLMRLFRVMDCQVENAQRLERPGLLVVANHPSLLDTVVVLAGLPNALCIVSGRFARSIFFKGPIWAAGYITANDPEAVVEAAKASLKSGSSVVVFPEGTRTTPDRPVEFRRGGANLALRTGTDITPVLIRCVPTTLTKGQPWYRIPPRTFQMDLRVLEDVPVDRGRRQPMAKAARQLTRQMSEHFNMELERFAS